MARTLSATSTSSPAATWSTSLRRSEDYTTALRSPTGPSGIPEVPTSGLPSPPSSPPLAAITSSNELAILPKTNRSKRRDLPGRRPGRRGGAATSIREEGEKFFCETMKAVFYGERNPAKHGSGLMGVYPTPPDDDGDSGLGSGGGHLGGLAPKVAVTAWAEIWDFQGGASFRAFATDDGSDKSLFVFFDAEVISRDLKQALMALIELAEAPLGCSHLVICIDRRIEAGESKALMKSLQWVGFQLTTLDLWANGVDVTSREWLFMGMEV